MGSSRRCGAATDRSPEWTRTHAMGSTTNPPRSAAARPRRHPHRPCASPGERHRPPTCAVRGRPAWQPPTQDRDHGSRARAEPAPQLLGGFGRCARANRGTRAPLTAHLRTTLPALPRARLPPRRPQLCTARCLATASAGATGPRLPVPRRPGCTDLDAQRHLPERRRERAGEGRRARPGIGGSAEPRRLRGAGGTAVGAARGGAAVGAEQRVQGSGACPARAGGARQRPRLGQGQGGAPPVEPHAGRAAARRLLFLRSRCQRSGRGVSPG